MIWLRKGVVFLLSLLLLTSLILAVVSIDANRQLGNPARLEGWLASSRIYDQIPSAVLSQAEKNQSNDGTGSVSFNDPVVQQAASAAFSSDMVQQSVNNFLNGNYDWLTGKKAAPEFSVDLSGAKQSFAQQIGQATQKHLASVPVCSPTQLTQLPIPVDPLTVSCRPGTLDAKAEGDRVAQEINGSNDLLAKPVITPGNLSQSGGQPYYKKLSWLPTAYQVSQKLPLIAGVLALLAALGVIFISSTRRRGLRRAGFVFLLAGLALIGLKLFADGLAKKFANTSISASLGSELKQPVSDLVRKLEPQLVRHYLLFGGFLVVVAIAVFVVLIASRQRDNRPKVPAAPEPEPLPESQPDDAIRLAPRRPSAAPDLAPKPSAPQLTPTAPAPLGKNPPRRKPPKLIQ